MNSGLADEQELYYYTAVASDVDL